MRQTQQQKNKAPNDFKRQIVEPPEGLETGDRGLDPASDQRTRSGQYRDTHYCI